MGLSIDQQLDSYVELQDCKSKILQWLHDPYIENEHKNEIIELIQDKNIKELRDRFYTNLQFGTGGLRGIMGQGFNRLNQYIVRQVTQGFANYILKCGEIAQKKGIAVAYDSRNLSEFFAKECASVLCANNIPVYIYPTLQTTPALSFAIRNLKCIGGLCITASHNPPQYNGIKVYWDDGAQIIPPQDEGILKEVFAVQNFKDIKSIPLNELTHCPIFKYIPDTVLNDYFSSNQTLQVAKNIKKTPISIVYTPLHGTGKIPALRALESWGFTNVFVVPEQGEPNGNFPTVKKPNPEEKEALTLAIQYAMKQKSDIVCATDPDSDRLAVAVYSPVFANGLMKHQSIEDYVLLNGNQTGALLIDHILRQKKENRTLKSNHKIIKTIVTSDLHSEISRHYGIEMMNTLTGFKWIAGLIRTWEQKNLDFEYLFGTEESFGFMPGNFVRDKDAIASLCLLAEMVSLLKNDNKNLCDYLFELFKDYGAWQEDLINVDLYGEDGFKKINFLMAEMRKNPILNWNGIKVQEIRDFTLKTCQVKYDIPPSNALQLILEDGSKISMRPSGTEPKLKYYISVCTKGNLVEKSYGETLEKMNLMKKIILQFNQIH